MRGVTRVWVVLLCLTTAWPAVAQNVAEKNDAIEKTEVAEQAKKDDGVQAVHALLKAQDAAWNRGDLKGYMDGYWHAPQLTFFAGTEKSRGWESAYRRYGAAYGKRRLMGKLEFRDVDVELLADDVALARGNWQLTVRGSSTQHGLFTLVLKKFDNGWRIIHDHSS